MGEGYTFFWKGLPKESPRIHGVGFAVKTKLLANLPESPTGINERLMTWRIPLVKGRYLTLISAYAPTLVADEASKDTFYQALDSVLHNISRTDKVVLMGDFNARVGSNKELWGGAIGHHGTSKMNDNGLRLLSMCAEHQLVITNTIFQLKDKYKNTWMHPRSKHWHMLDYVITRECHIQDVLITRVMRGADCWTDHRLVRSLFNFQIRPPIRKQAAAKKLDCASLKKQEVKDLFRSSIAAGLTSTDTQEEDPESEWNKLCSLIRTTAEATIGFTKRRHADWFDESSATIHNLLEQKRKAHNAHLANPHSHVLRQKWKDLRAEAQRQIRALENQWWIEKAQEIQGFADQNNMQGFYNAIKTIYGPMRNTLAPVLTADGRTTLKERTDILNRWSEHFRSLLNHQETSDETMLEALPDLPTVQGMDALPAMHEVLQAIRSIKEGKSCGPDGLPGELFKHGGYLLKRKLHKVICCLWNGEHIPKTWVDPTIIPIYKHKGDKRDCNNSRGLFLLAVAGKILARIMLARLVKHISEPILSDTQCGFRRERGTIDMIFALRQAQEKCIEQNTNLYIAFVDLTKAFDTVPRELLWRVLSKLGVPDKFLKIIQLFHSNMEATVCIGGSESPSFPVERGVKQGDVLAPVLFNLYISAVMTLMLASLRAEDGVDIEYRLDGSLFNIRRLQARTKTSLRKLVDLQYADDAAILAQTPESLQHTLDKLTSIYKAFGLQVNIRKTEIIVQQTNPDLAIPQFHIDGTELQVVPLFRYLGSIVSPSARIDNEILERINKASRAFGRLRGKVFQNKQLRLSTKVQVYAAVCISTLLYGAETWTCYRPHLRQLEQFHINCLQKILGLSWQDRLPHTHILERTNCTSIEALITQRQLRWVGHVIRMPDDRLPKQILYGQLKDGRRRPGGPKKRFKDQVKSQMKKCHIPPANLENTANDRMAWKVAVARGVATLEQERTAHRNRMRQQRHARSVAPAADDPLLVCPTCGKQCKSRIGLLSHTNAHRRREQQQQP